MSTVSRVFISLSLLFCLSGCENEAATDLNDLMENVEAESTVEDLSSIFYMIPSPLETAIVLKKSGANYDGSLLNNPTNVSNYDTKAKQAINLGTFGADMSYATLFDQSQEIMFFVSAAKKLAEELGIMKAFDAQMIESVENNIENRDSMMHIVSNVYWVADAYLKETENVEVSSLVLYGGWLEALHIASELYKKNPDNIVLKERIAEQKYSLENLLALFSKTSKISPELKTTYEELLSLKAIYDTFNYTEKEVTVGIDEETGISIVEGRNELAASKDQLENLFKTVAEIRKKNV